MFRQSDKFINNWTIKGTSGINPYAFKSHEGCEGCEVLYMKKEDQSHFILCNSSKGKLQSAWQRHINYQCAKI